MNEKDMTFKDFLEKFSDFGKSEWITAYSNYDDKEESSGFYCAVISKNRIKTSLSIPSWDLHIGHGLPGFCFSYESGKEKASYLRFSDEDVEPLLVKREFYGMKEDYWEISEEFRHYFNLYEDRRNNKFILIHDDGDEEDVILYSDSDIKIKLRLIKKFLAVKDMVLALYFSIDRFSEKTVEELGLKEFHEEKSGKIFFYSIGLRNWHFGSNDQRKSHAFLMGKKIIYGLKNFKPSINDENEKNKEFVDYIIGVDEDGREILHNCDENKLSNYFDKNPSEPHYLTPVLFKREVLAKYYSQPEKFSVEDGYLRCAGLWGLRMDNNHPDFIMVFLGDLGHLSIKEQQYWKTFNIPTKGKMSHVAWSRGFEAKFTDPERSDLFFKYKFSSFQKEWEKQFGWKLFKPLEKDDEHHFKTLRIPLTEEQKEFDEQVGSLTKIIIDSLNEKELGKDINEKIDGSINKLEKFLESKRLKFDEMIKFLRNLQSLRSSAVAHRKGKNYKKLKKYFSIGEKDLSKIFDDILLKSIWIFNTLERYFLPNEKIV